ncbi:protein of unknown function [Kyrpidia spormannii]|uniref:Uncharacterized protein n=1 Tax=Kyrpidia spormannii TaxID=2055160 RepID=A0A6F9EC79_9BACL|nr:protein of unknown function [Kyrpidia spormannii]
MEVWGWPGWKWPNLLHRDGERRVDDRPKGWDTDGEGRWHAGGVKG